MNEWKMLHQITKGLDYLHSKNVIHRDIKPTNILIFVPGTSGGSNEPQMKIADFGLSKILLKSKQIDLSTKNKTNPRGTRGWIAPELYEEDRRYDFKVDIFPLGCLFGYTLSKEKHHPFGDDPDKRSVQIKKKLEIKFLAQYDMKEPYSNDDVALKLIESMIKMDPKERPTAEEVLRDSFFNDYYKPKRSNEDQGNTYIAGETEDHQCNKNATSIDERLTQPTEKGLDGPTNDQHNTSNIRQILMQGIY